MAGYYLATTYLTHLHQPAGAVVLLIGLVIFYRPLKKILSLGLVDSWRSLNAEVYRAEPVSVEGCSVTGKQAVYDSKPLVVMCTVAVCLTLLEYFGDRNVFISIINRVAPRFNQHRYFELAGFAYWSGARVVTYIGIPALVMAFYPGERLRDYGLAIKGSGRHLWIYGVLYLIVLPAVIMVSSTKSFQHTYPFYKLAARSWFDFLSWEALYTVQFFALEIFFRGFMLHALKRTMGAYAIFAMVVPYCMIHYHKPLAEVLGAIGAGIVLGTLSLRTNSIWCGVLIHISVALSMDSLALFHTAGYPGNPRFVSPH